MSEYFRTVHIVRWECGSANYWDIVGAYTIQGEVFSPCNYFVARDA